jgi:FlaA1/EpsC-like NDP-sugar epimerase
MHPTAVTPSRLAMLATGRSTSYFAEDCARMSARIASALRGTRILIIGGAGSIGASTVRLLATHETSALHIVDQNENTLVELVRDLRGSREQPRSRELRLLPLDFGSTIMHRFLAGAGAYDLVLNFAAVKHVRSEKDVPSALHMLETNVLKQVDLLQWLDRYQPRSSYFSVSTDKAASPVNLMGASKRLMEHVMFSGRFASRVRRLNSARFANVAFSDGSLLQGWQQRLVRRQPLAVPAGTRRFFVSIEEAGQICLLAATSLDTLLTAIPRLSAQSDLVLLEDVAAAYLRANGYEPVRYPDAAGALADFEQEVARGRYPLLVTPLDTTGEKPFEEFIGTGESTREVDLTQLHAIDYRPPASMDALTALVSQLRQWTASATEQVSKGRLVELVRTVIPEFAHAETCRTLDDRL